MFKIGDFSKLSHVTIKALRYYDEIGLLKPAHVDKFTSYRFYTADQLPRLNRILTYKELGFPLDEIAQLLDGELSQKEIRGMLRIRQMDIQRHLKEEQGKLDRIEMRLRQLDQEDEMSRYDVILKEIDSLKVAAVRKVIPKYSDIGSLFGELFGHLASSRVQPAGPPFAIYHDSDYKEEQVDVEAAVTIDKDISETQLVKIYDLQGGEMACTIHNGSYESIGDAYNSLMKWIEENNYEISGCARDVYLKGPEMGADPSTFVTEVQIPVKKK